MTFSNCYFSQDPLANPLNARMHQCFGNAFNSKCKSLPEPNMPSQQEDLHVPQSTECPMTLADIQSIVDSYGSNKVWNDRDIFSLPTNHLDIDQALSRKDIEYWQHANEETAKLSNNMSDDQKQMMAEYESHFPPSKFEDV